MSLPGYQQRALDQIGHRLAAEDPSLGSRFAFFTRLTHHEAMPKAEQVLGRRQRFTPRATVLPLLAISLAALLTVGWLTAGSGQACPAGPNAAAHEHDLSSLSPAARCHPGPAIKLDKMPMH